MISFSALRSLLLLVPTLGLLHAPATALPLQNATRTVYIVKPTRSHIDRSAKLVGSVIPWQSMTVKSRVTGYVKNVGVMPGDTVVKDQVICSLDLPGLSAQLQAAEASVAEAQARVLGKRGDIEAARADVVDATAAESVADSQIAVRQARALVADAEAGLARTILKRRQALQQANAATQEEVEQAQGELDQAEAAQKAAQADVAMAKAQALATRARTKAAAARVTAAEAQVAAAEAAVDTARAKQGQVASNVAFGQLRCPYEEALVTSRMVDPGALALANQTELLTLMDVSRVRLRFHVPERIARVIKKGTRVVFALDDSKEDSRESTVSRVSSALNHSSRTMQAEVDLDNSDGMLYPGMFFHARVTVEEISDALVLPGSAIHTSRKQNYVLVVGADGTVARKNIKLGVDDGRRVQVLEGLSDGEQVVKSLVAGLREGDHVTVVEGK